MVYRCKMCGGRLDIQSNESLCKCPYCGSVQTLPNEKDERIQNLLNIANDHRIACDFTRAILQYEEILKLKESEPEAHWGLFLSKYGVEYVKDPITNSYKPTLHRISSKSTLDDIDFKATLKYSTPDSHNQYKIYAEDIESVMKEFLLISHSQNSYDIFLSYKETNDTTKQRTDDSFLAHDLYNQLTEKGYKVFFAPKSLGAGLYEPKIYSAIISSKVMIVLGTKSEYFNSVWVKNEWSRFIELIENGERKTLIPVFKFMEARELPIELAAYNGYNMESISFLPDLLNVIGNYANEKNIVKYDENSNNEAVFIERGFMALEDREFKKANDFFEKTLNLNPRNAQAYFGKLMVEMRVSKQEQVLTSTRPLNLYKNFKKAIQFADQKLKVELIQYEQRVDYNLDAMKYKECCSELASLTKTLESNNKRDNKENQVTNYQEYINGVKHVADKFKTIIQFKGSQEQINICNTIVEDARKSIEVLNQEIIIDKENTAKINRKNAIISGVSKLISILVCIGLFIVSLLPDLVNIYSTMFEEFKTYETWDKYILAMICLIVAGVLGFSLSMFYNSKRWKKYQWWDCVVSLIIYVSVVISLALLAPFLIIAVKWVLIVVAVIAGIIFALSVIFGG